MPAIVETDGLVLASVYDPYPAALKKVRERYPQVQVFTDSEAFFASGIDAVAITSPAPMHLSNVRDAARHGLPVLCEKPLAMDEAETEEMIQIATAADIPLSTALCYRFSPVAQRIKQLVTDGAIGDVRALRLIYIWNLHGKYAYDASGQRYESPLRVGRMQEGGPLVDCGVHQIDLALWWLQSPVTRQQVSAAWVDDEYTAPDHVWLHLDHANNAHSAIEMSFSYTHTAREPINHFSYHLIGTKGLIRYDRDNWHFEVRNEQGTQYLPGAGEKNFADMYAAWRDALESEDFSKMPSARDGQIVTRIARSATNEAIQARNNAIKAPVKF